LNTLLRSMHPGSTCTITLTTLSKTRPAPVIFN